MSNAPGSVEPERERVLGVAAVTFFVVSAAGPLVAMAGGAPVAMLLGNGAGVPAAFVLTALILLLFSAGYTAMTRHVQNAGGFYAMTARGLGGRWGGAAAFVALTSYGAMQLGLYGLFGAAAGGIVAGWLHVNLPWWLYSFAGLLSIAALGYAQIDLSVRVLSGLVACEYLVVLWLDGAIIAHGGAHGLALSSFTPRVALSGSPPIAILLCFSAFVGFEATTLYSEEARDPGRTIPRATYLSVLLIGIMYAVSSWCIVQGIGEGAVLPRLRASPNPTSLIFELSNQYVGSPLTFTMRLLFVTSAYASLLSFHNATSRYLFVLGREGLAPEALGGLHPVRRSPHRASMAQSAASTLMLAAAVLLGADPVLSLFSIASGLGSLGVIVLMALCSAAAAAYLRPGSSPPASSANRLAAAVAAAALAVVAVLGCARFDALSGHTSRLVRSVPLLLALVAALGGGLAERLRRTAPARFSRLGADVR